MNLAYGAYLAVMLMVVSSLLAAPLLALHGPASAASAIYNLYVPTCHQWIYRSDCVFYDGKNHWIGDCIKDGAVISTVYTNASRQWDGEFRYSLNQIGRNRAEKVEYGGTVGYKFANDTRNMGMYLSMLLAGVALPFAWKKPHVPPAIFFLIGILPLAIDGTGQFLGYWESTNIVRLATGLLAGSATAVYIYALLNR